MAYILVLGCVVALLFAAVIFYIIPREKSYEEGVAEKKSRHSNSKSKYSQQKKPVKTSGKEKSVDKKIKSFNPNPVDKVKKMEALNINAEKLDINANVKKKNDKISPKSNSVTSEKNQNAGNKNIENGKINEKSCVQDIKNNEKLDSNPSKNDNTLSIEFEVDSSISNSNSDKNAAKNSKPVSSEKVESKPLEGKISSVEKTREPKKSKENEEVKASGKLTKPDGKDKQKVKVEEKVKNAKDSLKNDEKAKEKLLASPSKNKKSDDKIKIFETLIVSNSVSPMYAQNGLDVAKIDKKDDKSQNNSNVEQRANGNETKSEKTQSQKKNTAVCGKVSPVQNGKNHNSNATKLTKRQATDIKTLQKISSENDGLVNVNLLIPLIAKAELSRTEIQNLIHLLLNKQQEDCLIDAEWIEGSRQDPMVKLKKQLAEKEKLLSTEQEAHQALQTKLKELRSELNMGKHTMRQLEETLNNRQNEVQAMNGKLQASLEEKQNFSKQIQQLQSKLNEERMLMHSLKEESSKTKRNLQQELLSQRQQLEMHIAHLTDRNTEAMAAMQSQLAQMAAQLQEQEAANAQMNEELRESVVLREQIAMQENQISHLRQTATATQDLVIQLEEQRAIRAELDRHVTNSQFEVTRLNNELKAANEKLSRRNAEAEKFNCTVQNMKVENQELLKENTRINEQINNAYIEKKELQAENEQLKKEILELKQVRRNLEEVNQLENQLLKNQVNEFKVSLEESLEESLSRNAELKKQRKLVEEIEDNFKKQLKKNDELRSKNWKAMEALSAMEKSFENKVKEISNLSHEIKTKEREELVRRLERLLPNVEFNSNLSVSAKDNVWFDQIEALLEEIHLQKPAEQKLNSSSPSEDKVVPEDGKVNMLYELEKQNNKLQSMVSHYKCIISDTEGMLNSLQKHVEQEENRWSEQVHVLESKLEAAVKERDILLSKTKMQNGCVNSDAELNEHKLNYDNKHSSILSVDYS